MATYLLLALVSRFSLSPGYLICGVVFLLMVMVVFLLVFNFWWLSYWLGQGSGVSAM